MKALAIFRTNIRYARLARGWSQEALAAAAGMTPQHYQDIEAGRRQGMHFATIERVAKTLHAEVWELFKPGRFPAPERQRGRSGPRIRR